MIHLNPKFKDKIEYLVGNDDINVSPYAPYDDLSCEFLNDLYLSLKVNKKIKNFPDVMSFAFWCRKANITKLKNHFFDNKIRIGLGLVIHITPSNVPVNFAFSFAFGLLSGNANVVRVPSNAFEQTNIICSAIKLLLLESKYSVINLMTSFVRYEQNDKITSNYFLNCNARIIWGGDNTIINIRKLPAPIRCVDIAFSDRFSLCVIDSTSLNMLDEFEIQKLAESFYNDSYLMDQNACSSPHLVIWTGNNIKNAKTKFWKALYKKVEKDYSIPLINTIDKYTLLCQNSIDIKHITNFKNFGNMLYVLKIDSIEKNIDEFRGKFGYFFEYETDNLEDLISVINNKFQTLTYFGFNKDTLAGLVIKNNLLGVDRIIPIGQAMDIGVIWDGYDIVKSLSRIIDVR